MHGCWSIATITHAWSRDLNLTERRLLISRVCWRWAILGITNPIPPQALQYFQKDIWTVRRLALQSTQSFDRAGASRGPAWFPFFAARTAAGRHKKIKHLNHDRRNQK